jgi:hypothetical protein
MFMVYFPLMMLAARKAAFQYLAARLSLLWE